MSRKAPSGFTHVGSAGLDSGLLAIGDPCYLVDQDKWPEFLAKWGIDSRRKKKGIVEVNGAKSDRLSIVVQNTGGDIDFNVFIKNDEQGLVKEIRIIRPF